MKTAVKGVTMAKGRSLPLGTETGTPRLRDKYARTKSIPCAWLRIRDRFPPGRAPI
jgi:hypothetical protein